MSISSFACSGHLTHPFVFYDTRHRRLSASPCRAALNDMITRETQRYIRHASKMSGQPLTPKDADMTNSLNALHAEIDALSAEKIVLAERLVKLFERAMARLQHDLQRILKLQGDEPGLPPTQHFLSTLDSTVQQLQTNLRAASVVAETPTVSTPVPPPPQKSTCFSQVCFLSSSQVLLNSLLNLCQPPETSQQHPRSLQPVPTRRYRHRLGVSRASWE